MLRLLHTGDGHLDEGPRFEDTRRCHEFMVEDGEKSNVQLWTDSGDLSGVTVPHVMTTLERNTLGPLYQRKAKTAPVVILYGNHDFEGDLDEFALLEAEHPIYVVDEPRVIEIPDLVTILAIPYPHKRQWLGEMTGTIAEQDRLIEGRIRELLDCWRPVVEKTHAKGLPVVTLFHGTYRGALLAGGEVIQAGQEIEIVVEDMEAIGADYNAAGHIHQFQQLGPKTWYAGSPSRSNFGETDEKGYLIVDVDVDKPPMVHRRSSPARRFQTLKVAWSPATGLVWEEPPSQLLNDAEARVRLEIAEQDVGAAPLVEIENAIREWGVFSLKIEKRVLPTSRIRCEEIVTARSLGEKLTAYWNSLNGNGPAEEQRDRCHAKLAGLEAIP